MSILTIVARYLHSIIKKNRNILYNHETNLLCQGHFFRAWADNEYFIICPRGF